MIGNKFDKIILICLLPGNIPSVQKSDLIYISNFNVPNQLLFPNSAPINKVQRPWVERVFSISNIDILPNTPAVQKSDLISISNINVPNQLLFPNWAPINNA